MYNYWRGWAKRVPGFEPGGREFESLRARHAYQALRVLLKKWLFQH